MITDSHKNFYIILVNLSMPEDSASRHKIEYQPRLIQDAIIASSLLSISLFVHARNDPSPLPHRSYSAQWLKFLNKSKSNLWISLQSVNPFDGHTQCGFDLQISSLANSCQNILFDKKYVPYRRLWLLSAPHC